MLPTHFHEDPLFNAILAKGQERFGADETGRRVRIPDSPERIVSLAPGITEILFALGLNKEIVGVTIYCDYPEVALGKSKIGGFVNLSIEKIVSLKPDLIIGTRDGNRWETIHRLNDLGFPVYLIDPKGFDGVIKMVKNIGEMVGRKKESEKIVAGMMVGRDEIFTPTQFLPKQKVFFQVGYAPIVTVGKGSLADDLIRLAGGRNISENERVNYPLYNIESILEKAPEIIITSSMDAKGNHSDLVKMWQNWKDIPAVQMKAIYVIDSNLVDRPSPRIIKGLEIMTRMIHPNQLGGKP